ncbi:MAG: hypothetical protein DRI83_05675 [Bacteroidetes bacterium]|nr:MAG: hypothetical protein DRI83_05675 [Bacteroidota bacterium]
MTIITNIREQIGRVILKRESARVVREKKIINLGEASSIGLIYYLPDEPTYRKISAYVKQLQDTGKTVKAIGYVESKRLTGQFLPKLSYDFLYPSGLRWDYKPVSTAAKDFIESEYDILMDLSTKDLLPLLFITGMSKAKFKAGMQSKARSGYLDLMIKMGEEDGLDELIKQINHYLSMINKKNES